MIDSKDVKRGVVGIIIASIFILAFFILKPIIIPIIFGLLFSYILSPVYKKIQTRIKNKDIAAIFLLFTITIIIIIPIIYLIPLLIRQSSETYILLQTLNFNEIISSTVKGDILSTLSININDIIYDISSTFQTQLINIITNLPSLILNFAVFLFTLYFAIRDSTELRGYISSLSPFSQTTEKKFLEEFRGITNAIIFGQVLIGIIQGLALGIGLFFLGVPKVLILTVIASLVSIIPVLGSWLVWFPVSIFLLFSGETFSGIFLFLYGMLFISTIDNFLRPYILSRQSSLPVALSIIGTIGGLYFFGIAGLIFGPLILAYVLIIIEFYRQGKLKDLFNK